MGAPCEAQSNVDNKYVMCGLGTLIAIGEKGHTRGVVSDLSKRAVRNVISMVRDDIILFHTVPSRNMEVDGV